MRLIKVCSAALLLCLASVAHADFSTPKEAALGFAEAISTGDSAKAQEYVHGTDEDKKVIGVMADMVKAISDLEKTAVEKLGEGARGVTQTGQMGEMVEKLKDAEATEEGDSATIAMTGEAEPLHLVKVDGKWLVNMTKMPDHAELTQSLPIFTAVAKVATKLNASVANDEIKTVEELQTAFGMQLMQAVAESMPEDAGDDHAGHDHGDHEGHDHGDHEGHDHATEEKPEAATQP